MSTLSRSPLPRSSAPDWRGWSVAICSGIGAGVLIGSEVSRMLQWQRPAGQIAAGAAVALLTASLAAKRPVAKSLVASILVAGACLMTIILRAWLNGHWPVGHVDHKWPVVFAPWAFYGCWPAILISLTIAAVRRRHAEPGAAPDGGPTTQPGNSRVTEGPPSVS
jgi:hypothetical protein